MKYDRYRLNKWKYHLARRRKCDTPDCDIWISKGDPCAYLGYDVIDEDSVEGKPHENPHYLYFCKRCYETRPDLQDLWAE